MVKIIDDRLNSSKNYLQTIIKILIENDDLDGLSAYCKGLPRMMRSTIEDAIGDESISNNIIYACDEPILIARKALSKAGMDLSFNEMDGSLYCNGKIVEDDTLAQLKNIGYTNLWGKERGRPMGEWDVLISLIAQEQRFHPIRDYFAKLEWDEKPRLNKLCACFTDEHEPIVYADGKSESVASAYIKLFLAGAMSKVMNTSGVDVQNPMLVLAGGQGLGKSTFAKWLCPLSLRKFFISSDIKPDNDNHKRYLATKFLWEAAELGSTTRRQDREATKAFLSQEQTDFRVPYATNPIQRDSITSFIGTINPEAGFLNDPTGSRRFRVMELAEVDWSYMELDIDQIWAEVFHYWLSDNSIWRAKPEVTKIQEEINEQHKVILKWDSHVESLFAITGDKGDYLSLAEIMDAIYRKYNLTVSNQNEITNLLTSLGVKLQRNKRLPDGSRGNRYLGIKAK